MQTDILPGTIHDLPDDLKQILSSQADLGEKWNRLTELSRNEWICWVNAPKKAETRNKHLTRLQTDILHGKKRPCCWPGCPHHNPSASKYFS